MLRVDNFRILLLYGSETLISGKIGDTLYTAGNCGKKEVGYAGG